MDFQAGSKLGAYEIIALLGAGGMGQVYRARDPKLAAVLVVGRLSGASWPATNTIVFSSTDPTTGLLSVSANGGTPKVLTKPDAQRDELDHELPTVLPNGRGILFAITPVKREEAPRIAVLDFQTNAWKTILNGRQPEYMEGSYLVYADGPTLRAVRFDADALEVSGEPVPVLEQVAVKSVSGISEFSVSRDGSLIYVPAEATQLERLLGAR
jgi:serine/threonine protein kinase